MVVSSCRWNRRSTRQCSVAVEWMGVVEENKGKLMSQGRVGNQYRVVSGNFKKIKKRKGNEKRGVPNSH